MEPLTQTTNFQDISASIGENKEPITWWETEAHRTLESTSIKDI